MPGAKIPFVDFEVMPSPYYTERHRRWRQLCRKWVTKELMPNINRWEKKKEIPREAYTKAYEYGIYSCRYPKEFGGTPFEGLLMDPFQVLILREEIARTACCAITTSVFIHTICIPPVLEFGNSTVKQAIAPVIRGEKLIALAVSESKYGSDVANLATTAVKSECGRYYIVNGEKKWISNGTKADFFTTAVRTGTRESKHKGISLLLIPKLTDGSVITARIPTQGHWPSHTTQIFFKNAKVPVEYLIGEENKGFYYVMANFNQERFGIACTAAALARQALLESINYARTRIVFDKPLIKSQVIRHKMADMAMRVLAAYSFLERVGYQMLEDPLGQKDKTIGANVCLSKVNATKCMELCAREASQILGGKSYTLGNKVDMIYRDVRALAIYGGSEEIMLDASTRLAKL